MPLVFSSLFSGSSGNATFIGTENTKLLIDAGLSGSRIVSALLNIDVNPCEIDALLVTHEHTDHTLGAGVLSRKYDIPIYANPKTWAAMAQKLGEIKEKNIRLIPASDFYIKELAVEAFQTPHDAADPVGYCVWHRYKKISILTDLGHMNRRILNKAAGSSIVLLESNHDVAMLNAGNYPYVLKQRILSSRGHLSNDDAAKAAVSLIELNVQQIVLGHLSRENNFEELAYRTVSDALLSCGAVPEKDIAVNIAYRDRSSGCFAIR